MGAFSEYFKGTGEAKVSKSGNYFEEGRYKVKIKAVKALISQEDKTPYFIIETQVLESTCEKIKKDTERSQVIDMSKVMGQPNVKAFIAAVSGVDPSNEEAAALTCAHWKKKLGGMDLSFDNICELCVDEKTNILENVVMDLECYVRRNKNARPDGTFGVFTKHNWLPRDVSKD